MLINWEGGGRKKKKMDSCIIKVVHNSGQPRKYTLGFKDKSLYICIHVQNVPTDLDFMAAQIKDQLVFKKKYSVVFNYKSVSESVKGYYPFKEKMIKLLQKKDPDMDFESLIEIVRLHMLKGKYPDFSRYDESKVFKKIANYVNSVSGVSIPNTTIIELCKKITTFIE